MFQLNLPKKTVAQAHVGVICLLIVLALIFSFLPIITLNTAEPEVAQGIEEIVNKFTEEEFEFPDKINVSAPMLIKSAFLMFDIVKMAKDNSTATQEEKDALEAKIKGETGRNTILVGAAIVHSITSTFKDNNQNGSSNIINLIFNVLITIVAIFYLLGVTIAMPIVFAILAIKALVPIAKNYKEFHTHTAAVANKLPQKLSIIMTIMLFQCVLPSMNYGSGTLGLWIVSIICVFVNFAVTRLTAYDKEDFIYLNIIQGASVVSIIGFFIFFFSVLKTNIFSTFTHGAWGAYIARVLASPARADAAKGYIVDALLILVYLVAVLSCVKFLGKCANRLSCAMNSKSGNPSLLPETIALLVVYILPTIVAGRKSNLSNPFDKSSEAVGSFLELGAEQKSALTMVLVGAIIMIAAEIAIKVLENVFCPNMTTEAKAAVLNNTATATVTEAPAAEVAPVAEAPAAEEAPVAEEAPAAEEAKEEVTEG